MKTILTVLLLGGIALVAQAPVHDATVSIDDTWDSQVSNGYGLKVTGARGGRVVVLHNAIWGMDDENHVRFQLFTDGTLHLFNRKYQQTIILDGENGQIWVNDKPLVEWPR